MEQQYNMRSPAVKRLMREAQELQQPTEEFYAQPLEDNLFEWHFTVRGPPESDFDSGLYHGRIILPAEYPMKPPSIILLTPNGRFETNKKICLSISGHHPESWQPSWSIRTALLAIIGFMPTSGNGAIGSLDYTPEERKALAKKSHDWKCNACGSIKDLLLKRSSNPTTASVEAVQLASQITFKGEAEQSASHNDDVVTSSSQPTVSTDPARISISQIIGNTCPLPLLNTRTIPHSSHNSCDLANLNNGTEKSNESCAKECTAYEEKVSLPSVLRQRQSEISESSCHESPTSESHEIVHYNTASRPNSGLIYYIALFILSAGFIFLLLRRLFFL